MRTKWQLGLSGGIVIACPLPMAASEAAIMASVEETARVGARIADDYARLITAQRPTPRARPRVMS
jgi:pseudouridine-5'-phosphate glycosidase